MTNEEAKEKIFYQWQDFLEHNIDYAGISEAYKMAIKALEQDSNCPYYVIDEDGHGLCMNHSEQKYCQGCKHNGTYDNDICLECEYDGRGMTRYEPQEPCGDAISRQAVIDAIDAWAKRMHILITLPANEVTPLFESVHELPPVTPEPKTGHWIEEIDDYGKVIGWHCDKCYEDSGFTTDCKWHCCPSCGAKMVESQESEDNE